MITALLTGHGHFSKGLYSALEMIVGEQEYFEIQVFEESMSMDGFKDSLVEKLRALSNDGENELFVFTDLKGGTPFNVSMMETYTMKNVHVFAGVNLPMLIEFCGGRMMNLNSEAIINMMLNAGKDGLVEEKLEVKDNSNEDESEGI